MIIKRYISSQLYSQSFIGQRIGYHYKLYYNYVKLGFWVTIFTLAGLPVIRYEWNQEAEGNKPEWLIFTVMINQKHILGISKEAVSCLISYWMSSKWNWYLSVLYIDNQLTNLSLNWLGLWEKKNSRSS